MNIGNYERGESQSFTLLLLAIVIAFVLYLFGTGEMGMAMPVVSAYQ